MTGQHISIFVVGLYLFARSFTDSIDLKTATYDYKVKYWIDTISGGFMCLIVLQDIF